MTGISVVNATKTMMTIEDNIESCSTKAKKMKYSNSFSDGIVINLEFDLKKSECCHQIYISHHHISVDAYPILIIFKF